MRKSIPQSSQDSGDSFYRSQWQKAPALPFPVAHRYGKNWKKEAHDFFKFVLYSEWRRQGNEDDLNGYTTSDSAWTNESDSKASEESGVWYNTFPFLNSLVSLLYHFFPLCRSTYGSLNSDIEKCPLGPRTSAISLSFRDTHSITSSHCPPTQEIEMSTLGSLPPVYLPNKELSGSQIHLDPCQPLPTDEALSYPAPASWRVRARGLDREWDLCLPLKRNEGGKRVTRETRFRVHRKQQTPEATLEKTELGHLAPRQARKPEFLARL